MKFPLIKGNTLFEVDLDNLLAISSDRTRIEFETFEGIYRPLVTLRDYNRYLHAFFVQIDKSTLIHLSKVTSYDPIRKEIQIEHNNRILSYFVSRNRARHFESLLH